MKISTYRRRVDAGRCGKCNLPEVLGSLCLRHLEANRERKRRAHAVRVARGSCVARARCVLPPEPGRRSCSNHLAAEAARKRAEVRRGR